MNSDKNYTYWTVNIGEPPIIEKLGINDQTRKCEHCRQPAETRATLEIKQRQPSSKTHQGKVVLQPIVNGILVPMLGVQLHPGQRIRFSFGTDDMPAIGTAEYENWKIQDWKVVKVNVAPSTTARKTKNVLLWSVLLYMTYLNWGYFLAGKWQRKYGCTGGGPGCWESIRKDMLVNPSVRRLFFNDLLMIIIAALW